MVTKSKMFSRAAAGWMLFFLLTQVYLFFMSTWQECKTYDEKFFKVIKAMYTEKSTRESMWLWTGMTVAMLVLTIALFLNNRGLFFFGMLVETGAFGYQLYKVIDFLNKQKNLKWTDDFTTKFIISYAVIGLTVLFILLMSVFLLGGSSAAKGFGILAAIFAFIGLALVVMLDILPYTVKNWKKASGVNISTEYVDFENYMMGLVAFLLIVKWGCARVNELNAQAKNAAAANGATVNPYSVTTANPYLAAPATGYANPTAALYTNPAAAQQPTYQAPQQAAPQAPQQAAPQAPQQPAYQAPQQAAPQAPQQAAYQAPEQPAYQAPQQPTYQAPEQPAYQPPEQPAYQTPEQPVYQAPEQPAYQAPEQSAYQAPEQPVYQAPQQAVEDYATLGGDVADNYEAAAANTADDFSAWTGGVIPGEVNAAVNTAADAADETIRQ